MSYWHMVSKHLIRTKAFRDPYSFKPYNKRNVSCA